MPAAWPPEREVSFLLIQTEAASRLGLIQALGHNRGIMKKTILIAFVIASVSTGIALAKPKNDWTLKGASRSEAMVTLSLVSKEQELLPANHQAAQAAATQHCSVWGFTGAELNGEIQRACAGRSRFGKCKRWEFTMPLQCTGGSSPTN